MRPIANFALHAPAAIVLAAFATTSASAALAAPIFMGAATSAAADRSLTYLALGDSVAFGPSSVGPKHIEILSYNFGPSQAGRVAKVDGFAIKQGTVAREAGRKGGTEDMNIGVGELQEAGKKPTTTQKMLAPGATRPTRGSAVGGSVGNAPSRLGQGSVTVVGRFPQCRVGARYPLIRLGSAARTYRMTNAVITRCGSTSASGFPTETVSFNYGKVSF